ncbi:MAG: dihydrodipicolinate synthase family protein [Candidatus Poribacteria bacterium]
MVIVGDKPTYLMNNGFQGVFPAVITPMTPEGKLNEDAFRKVIEFNIQAGVHGFWVAGGTGESVLLDDEENHRIAEIVADQNRGRVKNIMHVGAPTTARAAKMAEHAAQAGVEAICCVPPFFYGRTDDEIVEHYRIVAAAADLPLFIYNLPYSTGVEITPALMRKIQDRAPQLAGLKHSAPTFSNVRTFAKMGLCCLIGNCRLMLPALTLGATGCVDGPLNMAPEFWVEIWNAYQNGDLKRAEAAQDRAWEIVNAIGSVGGGFHAIIKAALSERLGIDCGAPRPPGSPLTAEQRTALSKRIEELGLAKV